MNSYFRWVFEETLFLTQQNNLHANDSGRRLVITFLMDESLTIFLKQQLTTKFVVLFNKVGT